MVIVESSRTYLLFKCKGDAIHISFWGSKKSKSSHYVIAVTARNSGGTSFEKMAEVANASCAICEIVFKRKRRTLRSQLDIVQLAQYNCLSGKGQVIAPSKATRLSSV
jgi:hypothetical protein